MTEKPPAFTVVDKRMPAMGAEEVGAILSPVLGAAIRDSMDAGPGAAATVAAGASVKPEKSAADIERAVEFHYGEHGRSTASVHEVYEFGLPLWCFTDGKPNCALVRPIRRPAKSAGGIITSTDEKRGTLGTNAIAYQVLQIGAEVLAEGENYLGVEAGDVVILRNAMLEPLDETLNTLSIHRSHILAKVDLNGF